MVYVDGNVEGVTHSLLSCFSGLGVFCPRKRGGGCRFHVGLVLALEGARLPFSF